MIEIIREKISQAILESHLGQPYDSMIKFVVDLHRQVMVLGGQLHADGEALLLRDGSSQSDLWGGNYFPKRSGDEQVEYTSMINIRPSARNFSTEVKDEVVRKRMLEIVRNLLPC